MVVCDRVTGADRRTHDRATAVLPGRVVRRCREARSQRRPDLPCDLPPRPPAHRRQQRACRGRGHQRRDRLSGNKRCCHSARPALPRRSCALKGASTHRFERVRTRQDVAIPLPRPLFGPRRKPRDPSVYRDLGASTVAVTVGFEPLSQANGCRGAPRDPRESAEVGHMCAHLRTGSRRNYVTAALPLGACATAYRPTAASGSARYDQTHHRASEGLRRACPVRPALPVSSSRTARRSRPR